MKVFEFREYHEAIDFALSGKVALHVHNVCFDHAPKCFRDAVRERKECIGHLFDQDRHRLVNRAGNLGINVIYVDAEGTTEQHIDLCGKAMRTAIQQYYRRLLLLGKKESIKRLRNILGEYPGSKAWI